MKTGKSLGTACLLALALCFYANAAAGRVTQESLPWQGKSRTFYLYLPSAAPNPARPAPLVLLLHGSGRNGSSLMDSWAALGASEGLILVAPDAANPAGWSLAADGPDFMVALVARLAPRYPIDPSRLYLFGHSAGGVYALALGLLESQYFAAVAVHAGALNPGDDQFIAAARRKIPLAIFVGDRDNLFTPAVVGRTRDALQARGFPVKLVQIPNHDHWYYDLAPQINRDVWEFLKASRLPQAPLYQAYRFVN